ncbi:DNA replication licensing factor MCM3 [Histomonas meleagridis]|uniref:DNA replication licensing factor MCM3 n=1 Tax=Histomonas meleagridis TaxID=135588 RepID=UPI0035599DDA|nr:DNA replication licensing factor MCM3 [Histomonas meleagridis]KAH0799026.1 DNA replication licensing factor MCM3 [Histomonas meleagridis]
MTEQVTQFYQLSTIESEQNRDEFIQFLDGTSKNLSDGNYRDLIERTLKANKKRVIVNLDHFKDYDQNLAQNLIREPRKYLEPLENAVNQFVSNIGLSQTAKLSVGITGSLGERCVTPRKLSSRFLTQLICLDGIVTKTSLVHPKLQTAVQYSEQSATHFSVRQYYDATSLNELPSRVALPTTDIQGNPLEMEFGLSTFVDRQLITIQERPETAPAGQMPRSCDVILENDLADTCKPGDRVKIYGVYRIMSGRLTSNPTGIYRALVIANNVEVTNQSQGVELTDDDISAIRRVCKENEDNIIDLLGSSLAPSICGHLETKKALMAMLVGGNECNLADGTHIRGDINVLMVGDPSTAKSQLLRRVMSVAPLAVHTTGRGSSGVGLTASVTSDPETGERRLEAGAMVIADRGVVCIDEFDKMDETDRVAIHEALEQQTVTISKAGIHTSLHARCSVVAAANPVWGTYNPSKSPMENVGLPDSLLSRFDLLFIVLDLHDPQVDATIADHVLRSHRWRGRISEVNNGVYIQADPLLHGNDQTELLTIDFLKKYIVYAKKLQPELQQSAIDKLVSAFADLRAIGNRKTQPITPRAFETLIRLSTAHAKLRLSEKVTDVDADEAIALLKYAIFGDVESEQKKKKKKKSSKKSNKEEIIEEKEEVKIESRKPKQKQKISFEEKNNKMMEVVRKIASLSTDQMSIEEFIKLVEKEQGFAPNKDDVKKFIADHSDNVMLDEKEKNIFFF